MRNISRHVLLGLFGMILISSASADTVNWEFNNGWGSGHHMTIDTSTKTISLTKRGEGAGKSARLKNSDNVVAYISGLLTKMPEERGGEMRIDGGKSQVTCSKNGITTERTIYTVRVPGAVFYTEGASAENALNDAESFVKGVDAFLVSDALFRLKELYFPEPKGE